MAILWQKQYQGTRYEVRSAGRTRRLYTDGVFHSQYRPRHALAGGIWDLLLLPIYFRPEQTFKHVLVLGVGGGTILHQLQRYARVEHLVGVELNPVHLQVARRYFGIQKSQASLHRADAVEWLRHYRGPAFDLIIEDLFGEEDGEPVRPVAADKNWFRLLNKNLTHDGILVMNFIGRRSLRDSAWYHDAGIRNAFAGAYQFTLPAYENYIVSFLKQPASSKLLRERLGVQPELAREMKQGNFNFTLRRLTA